MQPTPDGWQYGVMFEDGSVYAPWNGRTQPERALEHLRYLRLKYSRDRFYLARRRPYWVGVGKYKGWLIVDGA